MLPEKNRTTFSQFRNFRVSQIRFSSEIFDIFFKHNESGKFFVFIVPKYIDKRSSRRHLYKRIMTESIRSMMAEIKKTGFYMVKFKKNIQGNNKKIREEVDMELRELILRI